MRRSKIFKSHDLVRQVKGMEGVKVKADSIKLGRGKITLFLQHSYNWHFYNIFFTGLWFMGAIFAGSALCAIKPILYKGIKRVIPFIFYF